MTVGCVCPISTAQTRHAPISWRNIPESVQIKRRTTASFYAEDSVYTLIFGVGSLKKRGSLCPVPKLNRTGHPAPRATSRPVVTRRRGWYVQDRALPGRLKCMVRRHTFNKSLFSCRCSTSARSHTHRQLYVYSGRVRQLIKPRFPPRTCRCYAAKKTKKTLKGCFILFRG
jgi:hypothetical protein